MKILACLFFVFAVAQAKNTRIVNGEVAKPKQFPWQAFLKIKKEDGFISFCGGSLISKNWILTAAHCLNEEPVQVEVILGAHNRGKREKWQIRMKSKKFFQHEKWKTVTDGDDIALIRLPKPVKLSKRIQLVHLPDRSDVSNTFEGTLATVSGWGKTTSGHSSKLLRFVEIPIISNAECHKSFADDGINIFDSMICAVGKTGKGVCNGDSGGPIVKYGVQIGIVSFGKNEKCESGNPQVYTRVTSYLDWIEKNTDGELKIRSGNDLTRIVNGNNAKPNQFPWQAFLQNYKANGKKSFCGGSLISENWVLTASHCLDEGVVKVQVTLGAVNRSAHEHGQIRMNSTDFILHEDWKNTKSGDDIGLIRLPEPVKFTKRIQPVKLPSRSDEDNTFAEIWGTVSGWGRTSDQQKSHPKILQFVDVIIFGNKICSLLNFDIMDSMVCAGGMLGKTHCRGDSGGPLVVKDKGIQVGIVSYGKKSCQSGYPRVYTRITSFLDWIEENTDGDVVIKEEQEEEEEKEE